MRWSISLSSLKSIGQSIFELESGIINIYYQTERINISKPIDGQTNCLNFESSLAIMVVYLTVKIEIDWSKHFLSPETTTEQTDRDRQSDDWHTILIGGLVPRNPAKNEKAHITLIDFHLTIIIVDNVQI